jgi:hypothetical protein
MPQQPPFEVPDSIVDLATLVDALRVAGVPDGEGYVIPGHVRLAADIGGYQVLDQRDGRWFVGAQERGTLSVFATFPDVSEAAQVFYEAVVTNHWSIRNPNRRRPQMPRLRAAEARESEQ